MTASAVPVLPVVSGRIYDYASILTTTIAGVQYYLTYDVNNVPFFMQFRKGTTNGLDTVTNNVALVKVTLAVGSTSPIVTLRTADTDTFYVVNPNLNYVGPPDPQATQHALYVVAKDNADNSLLAVGVSYTLVDPVNFLVLQDNVSNPHSINITTMSPSTTNLFFVTQVDGLVDTTGTTTQKNIYPSIYSYTVGDGATIQYFFTSQQDGINGNYIPYSFCPTKTCGPNCLGPCNGDYSDCKRETQDTNTFSCVADGLGSCTYVVISIMIVFTALVWLVIGLVLFGHHGNYEKPHIFAAATGISESKVKAAGRVRRSFGRYSPGDYEMYSPEEKAKDVKFWHNRIGGLSTSSVVILSITLGLWFVAMLVFFVIAIYYPSLLQGIFTASCNL